MVAGFAFVNADGVSIGIRDQGHVTDGRLHGLQVDVNSLLPKPRHGGIKVFHFKSNAAAIGTGLPFLAHIGNGKGVGSDFILDPVFTLMVEDCSGGEIQRVFIKVPSPSHIGDGIAGEREFDDFKHSVEGRGLMNLIRGKP